MAKEPRTPGDETQASMNEDGEKRPSRRETQSNDDDAKAGGRAREHSTHPAAQSQADARRQAGEPDREAEEAAANENKEKARTFIEAFVNDMPGDIQMTGRFEPKPEEQPDLDLTDGWYADRGWAIEVRGGKLVKALGPAQADRPTTFTAV